MSGGYKGHDKICRAAIITPGQADPYARKRLASRPEINEKKGNFHSFSRQGRGKMPFGHARAAILTIPTFQGKDSPNHVEAHESACCPWPSRH
jgi:hypothetical protein